MKIDTKYFGTMELDAEEEIYFPEGLPGFEDHRRFVLIRFFDDDDCLLCLQSVEQPDLAFVVTNPFYVDPQYSPQLKKEDLELLQCGEEPALAFYAITVVQEDFRKSTVNLRCPVAVNPEKRVGRQILTENDEYSMHAPIASEGEAGEC